MTITRLGWDVLPANSPRLVDFPWVTGKVRGGDHYVVLNYSCQRINEFEPIRRAISWGYNARDVRNNPGIPSEHNAGVAIDVNAPEHWLGLEGTWTNSQVSQIHGLLADLSYAVRWGGDYRHANGDPRREIRDPRARLDEMHFELQGGNKLMKQVADQIRAHQLPEPWEGGIVIDPVGKVDPIKPKPRPKPKVEPTNYDDLVVDGDLGPVTVKALQILMRAVKTYTRAVDGDWGKYTKIAVQEWLKGLGYYKRAVDGSFGKYSVIALQQFLASKHRYPGRIDGDMGPMTVKALQAYLNSQNQ